MTFIEQWRDSLDRDIASTKGNLQRCLNSMVEMTQLALDHLDEPHQKFGSLVLYNNVGPEAERLFGRLLVLHEQRRLAELVLAEAH